MTFQEYCSKCSFHCDSASAMQQHWELHNVSKAAFICSLCDYTGASAAAVRFHEQHHHAETPFALLHSKNEVDEQHIGDIQLLQLEMPSTLADHSRPELRCGRCVFRTGEIAELAQHWDTEHTDHPVASSTSSAARTGFMLKLNLVPRRAFVNSFRL
jgi:hypothetical protein